jgi:hypothetical protein
LLWAETLNTKPRPDLFAMHHADLTAKPNWLDDLVDEMIRVDCDLLSCVVAIKDPRGLTSTGLLDVEKQALRRVTIRELEGLPETFGVDELIEAWKLEGPPENFALCVNTGLWVCRFGDWAERVQFETGDHIDRDGDKFTPRVFSEDWMFSATLAAMGLRVKATKKIQTIHYGIAAFGAGGTTPAWGRQEHDDFTVI